MGIDELTNRMGTLCALHQNEMDKVIDLLSLHGEPVVLACLSQADDTPLSGELAEKCGLSTGRVANLLRQLEGKGLVARRHDESDRRKTYVQLTDAGRAEALHQLDVIRQARSALLAYLGESDADEFVRLLERCLAFCSQTAA
jgi:DNA-binding MarR family transcriptional regulator